MDLELKQISSSIANPLIYVSLGVFLTIGVIAGWKSKKDLDKFIKAIYSQRLSSLAMNFVAVNLGSSMFYSLPEYGTIAGLMGVFVYALASAIPIFFFSYVGPLFRKHNAETWSMTLYLNRRYGVFMNTIYGLICVVFMFLYMVGELTTINGAFELLTDVNPLVPVIVLAAVVTIYSSFGGVYASLITDAFQSVFALVLIIMTSITIAVNIKIPQGAIENVGLLKPTKVGWVTIYVMIIALLSSAMFHQGFWQRAFASKNNRDLRISTYIGGSIVFILFTLVGIFGLLAAWSGTWSADSDIFGYQSYFTLLATMPSWVIAITVVIITCLACSALDTCMCAMIASINDLTYQKMSLRVIRVLVLVIMIPVVVVSLEQIDVLKIFLLADLMSSATFIPIFIGLIHQFSFIEEFDACVGAIGGILSVGIFGTIYYGNAKDGWGLLMLPDGLYMDDYSVLGAFLAAPIGSLIFTGLGFCLRSVFLRFFPRKQQVEQSSEMQKI